MEIIFNDTAQEVIKNALMKMEINDMSLGEFIERTDKATIFLRDEITICKEQLQDEKENPFYNGVNVGTRKAKVLTANHILFCKKTFEDDEC